MDRLVFKKNSDNLWALSCPASNSYRYKGLDIGSVNEAANAKPYHEHAIMTGGNDPYVGAAIPVVDPLEAGNTCSARLGNDSAWGGGGTLQYSWVVTATNNSFSYDYAVVMYNPAGSHTGTQEPYFQVQMWAYTSATDSTIISCASYYVTPETANGFLSKTVNGLAILYKPWTSVTIPLDAYIGQKVKIIYETRDCCPTCPGTASAGEHFCYAYLGCGCAPLNIIPEPPATCNSIPTKLVAPAGAASYAWTGPHIVSGATTQTVTVSGTGTYSVNMTTFGQTTCTYTRTVTIGTLPTDQANFSANTPCVGTTTVFTDSSTIVSNTTYTWDFGDGTATSNAQNPTHTYAAAGTYPVKLSLTANCPADTTINVIVLPYPTSTFSTQTVCLNAHDTITYTGTAPPGSLFTWNFDGGTIISGSGQGPYIISWSTDGTKNISLSINSNGCISSNTVTAIVNPIPVITATSATVCVGISASISVSGANFYTWSTGASTGSITAAPSTTTTYTVIGNSLGCLDTTTTILTVNPIPIVTVNTATICNGQGGPGTLTAGGADSYSWSTGATTNILTDAPTSTTTYTVTGSSLGCINTATGTITVNPIPVVTASSTTVCAGTFTTLTASGADSYTWSNGATTSTMTDDPIPTTTYTVTGNSLGCISTATGTITTKTAPILTANSATICIGQTATLTVSGAATYTWSTGATTSINNCIPCLNNNIYHYRCGIRYRLSGNNNSNYYGKSFTYRIGYLHHYL